MKKAIHTIYIETVTKCNLSCTYCHRTLNEFASKNKKIKPDLFYKVIDGIDLSQSIYIRGQKPQLFLHGYGEPTLHKELENMIAYAAKSNKFSGIRFVSNFLAVPKEKYDSYFAAGLTDLYISLDTLDSGKIEATRKGTDVKMLMEAMSHVATKWASNLRVITVLSQINKSEIFDIQDWVQSQGIKIWNIQLMNDFSSSFPISPEEIDFIAKTLKSRKPDWMTVNVEGLPYPKCNQPNDTLFVNVVGELTACCTFTDHNMFKFGSVGAAPIKDVFLGPNFEEFRKEFNAGKADVCLSCPYYGRDGKEEADDHQGRFAKALAAFSKLMSRAS